MRLNNNLRFVHAADLHLDSPFVGFSNVAPPQVVSALRDATFDTYDAIIELCLEEQVDALLVAGDVYDGADKSLRAQLRFLDGLKRLSAAGIRSFICHGNHDPLDGWEAGFATPPGCHRFGDMVEGVPLDPDEPGRAMVYGYSYPRQRVVENMASRFRRADDAAFAVGLLHCNVGAATGHADYAPCSIEDLSATGMDYWALGHVHTRQVLREHGPTIVYPGNPQGRHPNETGARGVYLVDVGAGGRVSLVFRAIDRVRWTTLTVDIGEIEDDEELQGQIEEAVGSALEAAEGRHLVYRVEIAGRGPLHESLIQPGYLDELREHVNAGWARQRRFAWCDRITDRSGLPFDRGQALAAGDFLAELLREFDEPANEASLLTGLAELYQHQSAGRYLREAMPKMSDLPALFSGAEAVCIEQFLEEAPR
jgi:DNA repair exonuclease SbcCD nuclease subunit